MQFNTREIQLMISKRLRINCEFDLSVFGLSGIHLYIFPSSGHCEGRTALNTSFQNLMPLGLIGAHTSVHLCPAVRGGYDGLLDAAPRSDRLLDLYALRRQEPERWRSRIPSRFRGRWLDWDHGLDLYDRGGLYDGGGLYDRGLFY